MASQNQRSSSVTIRVDAEVASAIEKRQQLLRKWGYVPANKSEAIKSLANEAAIAAGRALPFRSEGTTVGELRLTL